MKTKTKLRVVVLFCTVLALLCFMLAGCFKIDYEAMYYDDAKISGANSSRTVASVESGGFSKYEFSCYSFSGTKTAKNTFKVGEDAANVSLSVSSGKFKIVLTGGGNVYTLIEQNEFNGALPLDNVPDGKYKMKIVGVDAEVLLTVSFN